MAPICATRAWYSATSWACTAPPEVEVPLAGPGGGRLGPEGRPDDDGPPVVVDDVGWLVCELDADVAEMLGADAVTVVVTVTVIGGRVWFSSTGESEEHPVTVASPARRLAKATVTVRRPFTLTCLTGILLPFAPGRPWCAARCRSLFPLVAVCAR